MVDVVMSHFRLKAPPPEVPADIHARAMSEGLRIKPVKLSYEEILEKLKNIGDDWHLRPEHLNGKRTRTKQKLEGARTHTWAFLRGDKEIGICIAVKKGFDSSLADKFGVAAKGTEIYKIGLYPDYQHKGYGDVFLPAIQVALMHGQGEVASAGVERLSPSEMIYLNTRDTNSTDSRNFYSNNGWSLIGQEVFRTAGEEGALSHRLVPMEANDGVNDKQPRKVRPLRPLGSGQPRIVNG